MVTLAELNHIVEELFSDGICTLPRIIYAWAWRDPDGTLDRLLRRVGSSTRMVSLVMEPHIHDQAKEDQALLSQCIIKAAERPVTGFHLLKALCQFRKHRIAGILEHAHIDLNLLEQQLEQSHPLPTDRPKPAVQSGGILLTYGRDLLLCAEQGDFDNLCDRPSEIDRLVQVLMRNRKKNAVLTGPAGVGKTALVELFARRLARGDVPDRLNGTRLYEISMGSLVAGTRYRGMFEERIDMLIKTLIACQPAIIFIDEMHLLWGAGRAEGAPMDGANLLKPALSSGKISVIGATTSREYHHYITRDAALARRFQEIRLEEPDRHEVLAILKKCASEIEQRYPLLIEDSLLSEALTLTDRHLPNRYQPDKSIDLIDSAAVLAELEHCCELRRKDLYRVLARQTGRSIEMLDETDRHRLKTFKARLSRNIIGQNHAIETVASTLIHHRFDFGDIHRNLGTFLFAGSTGVGKTELARAVAREFFGSEKDLLHLDLGEYSQGDAIHKLIGMPYDYGVRNGSGTLVTWIHERGSGVLLFDEIEKAHPQVHHLLLGLLDEGRIHSGFGEKLDTRHCVVILTTNALTADDLNRTTIGLVSHISTPDPRKLLRRRFSEEFLGRFDEIILFNMLDHDAYRKILKLKLCDAVDHLKTKGVFLCFDENRLLEYILGDTQSYRSDARDIKRLLETKLLQPLTLFCLDIDPGRNVEIIIDDCFYRTGSFSSTPLEIQFQNSLIYNSS